MADQDFSQSEEYAFTEVGGADTDRSTRTASDTFRFTEQFIHRTDTNDPLLARPLYALIETAPRTADIVDYLELIPDDEWRETGIDIDI